MGGFSVQAESGEALLLPRKARALLAYLALQAGRPVSREKLATLLWEDKSDAQSRASLRQALAAIRRVEGAQPLILADAESCALAPDITVDVVELARLGNAEARAAAHGGELLDGFTLPEAGFSAWLATERAQLRDLAIKDLADAAEAALAERRPDAAAAAAQRLVGLDPLHEAGHRLLMRAYAGTGRPAEALRQYRRLQALLRRDLGAAPEPETVAVAQAVARRRLVAAEDRLAPAGEPMGIAPTAAGTAEGGPGPATGPEDAMSQEPGEPRRELRRMVVLSVGITEYAALSTALDVEQLQRLLVTTHAIVEQEAERSGGHVLDRRSDGLTMLFGAGVARDDDPLRAAGTAQAIHDRIAAEASVGDVPIAVRIGIAAGPLLLVETHGQISAYGETLATASELRMLADPGATLVPGPLLAELGERFETLPAGRHRSGSLHRLAGPAAQAPQPPMAGRTAELAQVEALLDIAAEGTARTLILRGEAGIGKSRLAEAAVDMAEGRGWRTLRAIISDFGEFATISPRRQLVLDVLRLSADTPLPDSLADHPLARRLSADELPILYQLAGGVAPNSVAPEGGAPASAAEIGRSQVFGALMSAAAERAPLLILVEDAHWASAEVLSQLQVFSRNLGSLPALLLITTRAEPDLFDQRWRAGAGPLSTIDLAPIGRAESRSVVESLGVTDAEQAAELMARAGGNPLFLRQLVAAVREGVAVSEALPGSVQGLALGRMDRLGADERLALRASALLGPRAELDAVRAISGLADYVPGPQAVGSLIRFDGHAISFVHALIRDAVGSTIMPSERPPLHRAAADWYRGRNAELHALHLDFADDPRAAAAWADAADEALGRHRPDKALGHLVAGLRATTTAPDRFRLNLCKARVLMRQLEFGAAASAARAARDDAPSVADRVQAMMAHADAETAAQRPDQALALLDEAEALAEPAGLTEAMARILGLKGNIHFPRGDLARCLADHGAALLWARRAGSGLAEAGALAGLGWAHYQRGAFGEACRHADQCIALASDRAFDRIRLSALRLRSISRVFLLEHDGALADATASMALAADQGDALNEILARTTAGTVHLERWDQRAAIDVAAPALALVRRIGRIGLEAAPLWVLGTAHGAMGDADEARRLLRDARDTGTHSNAIRFAVPRILGTLAFFTDAQERALLVAEAERILRRMPVAHSANGFYGSVLHAALVHAEHDIADLCAAGLRRHQIGDAEPWVAAMLEFATLYTALSRGAPGSLEPAQGLHARARSEPALYWLRPTMRLVEKRVAATGGQTR